MEELYQFIEEKIRKAGYPGMIDGREFYSDVSKEAEDQEIGTYIFIVKKSDMDLCQDFGHKKLNFSLLT